MATCELKNTLEKLHKQKRELVNQAKNEIIVSEILSSNKEDISKADIHLIASVFGKVIGYIGGKIGDVTKTDELVAELSNVLLSDKTVQMKMKYLKLTKPDPKFTAIDMSMNADALRASIVSLNKSKAIAKLTQLSEQKDRLTVQSNEEGLSAKDKKSIDDRLDIVDGRLSGKALEDAMNAVPNIASNDVSMFPTIFAVTQTYDSKNSGITDRKQPSTYNGKRIDQLEIRNNTLDSKHGNMYSSDQSDEVSALAMLFGTTNVNKTAPTSPIVIPDYAKNAIKINALEKMADVYKMLAYEPFSQEFDDVWGLDKSSSTYEADLARAQEFHLSGLIPQSTIMTSLGKAIYKSLPTQFSGELDVEMEQKAIGQLGMYALRYMHNAKLIALGENPEKFNDNTKDHILIYANHTNMDGSGIVKQQDIMALVNELQFLGATEGRTSARAIGEVHEVSQTIRNSFIETSETVRENLKAFESTELQFNSHMKTMYEMYNNSKEAAYAMAGVLSVDTSKPVIDQMKELAKINYAKMQVDAMIIAYEQFGDTEKFTLPYDYTVSGRYMINSVFNPQESKISRFLVTSTDLDSIITRGSDGKLDAKDLQLFQVGVSQSFDLDPDKTTDENAIKSLDEIVTISDSGAVSFKDTIKGKDNPFKKVYAFLVAGKMSGDISEDVKVAMMEVNRKGSGFHAMQAIMALKQLDDASKDAKGGDIKLAFSLESDAITSGMILTLLEISTPTAIALAEKGGVYTQETIDKWQKLHSVYQAAGGQMKSLTMEANPKQFKLTHGWLKAFSKEIESFLGNITTKEQIDNLVNSINNVDSKMLDEIINSEIKDPVAYLKNATKFNDVYETVASTANTKMQESLSAINEEIENMNETISDISMALENGALENKQVKVLEQAKTDTETELSQAKLKLAMVNMVGAVKRSLAKPSVMVYIYGAMIDSIKRKMTGAVVMPKVYDLLVNSYGDVKYNDFKNVMKMFNDDPEMLSKLDPQTAGAMQIAMHLLAGNPSVSFKKLEGNAFVTDNDQLMKNIIIGDKTVNKLQKTVNETLGAAFEEGFKEFKEIDEYRDSVKSAEIVRFTMFKYNLDKGLSKVVKRMQGEGRYKISSRDIASVINELEKNGFGHSVRDINGGKQPLYKKDALEKEVRTMLALNLSKVVLDDKGQKKTVWAIPSAALEGKEFAPNTGASGVITVHSKDGYTDAVSARMYNLIRIYDGSVSGINKLNESVVDYNKTWLEAATWNSYNTQANDLAKQISIMEESGEFDSMIESLNGHDKDALLNSIEKLMGYGNVSDIEVDPFIASKQKKVQERVAANRAYREGGEKELHVGHSYLSDLADPYIGKMDKGDATAIEPLAVETLYRAYGKILKGLKQYKESLPSKEVVDNSGSDEQSRATNDMSVIDGAISEASYRQDVIDKAVADATDGKISLEEAKKIIEDC